VVNQISAAGAASVTFTLRQVCRSRELRICERVPEVVAKSCWRRVACGRMLDLKAARQEKDMKLAIRTGVVCVALVALGLVPRPAHAQRGDSQLVRCLSDDEQRHLCDLPFRRINDVRVEQQISGSPCIQGRSWGFDEHTLWVDRGCRAEFRVFGWTGERDERHDRDDRDNRGEAYEHDRGQPGRKQRWTLVRCSSDDERQARCHVDGNVWNVQLERQISGTPCILGQSWGFDDDEVWVDRGCRADFRVFAGGGYGRRSQIVRCKSDDERMSRCHVEGGVWNVQLDRQYSGSPCTYGQTWGFDDDEIWVSRGCRADFRVWAGGEFARRSGVVRCSSDDERLNRCRVEADIVNVRVEQQYSGTPCILGQTWGFDDDEVWVDRGCRADFRVWIRR
jgi:Protein of unknown function (DUF3011)